MTLYEELDNALSQNDFDKFCELWAKFLPSKNKTYEECVENYKRNHGVKCNFNLLRKNVLINK